MATVPKPGLRGEGPDYEPSKHGSLQGKPKEL
jgi:hypothetical protein